MRTLALPVATGDGHRADLQARIPENASASLLWLPGMGLAARHFLPFAEAMAAHGIATFVHEWRGNGASNLRASRATDWGYRELLADIAASERARVRDELFFLFFSNRRKCWMSSFVAARIVLF